MKKNKSVLVGMSGGVDSSVSAALLIEQGFSVAGVLIRFHEDEKHYADSLRSASVVCRQLGIDLLERDYRAPFRHVVMDYFVKSYQRGITPNPCIMCNPELKFKALLATSDELKMDYVATGHYCKIRHNPETGRFELIRSTDCKKDQTYFLYRLGQYQLSRMITPLSEYDKEKVRQIALSIGLEVAQKKDSQEICFIPDGGNHVQFIEKMTGIAPPLGDFVDESGNFLGKHKGIPYYTIGQRKGLGISLGRQAFVTKIHSETNKVVLGDEKDLLSSWLMAEDCNMVSTEAFSEPTRAQVKIRSTAAPAPAYVYPTREDGFRVEFDEPQKSVTPGQSAVVYQEDKVLGGGIITKGGI